MAAATSMVAATITGPKALGRMWRTTRRALPAPSARAASTNSFSRSDRNWARTSLATGIQRKPPMTTTMRTKMPPSDPNTLLKEFWKRYITSSSSGSRGSDKKRSVSHMRPVPTAPRDMPATAPTMVPTPIATNIAASPTAREMRPP